MYCNGSSYLQGTVDVAQGLDGAAEATVASAVADTATVTAARSLAQTVVSQTALMSFGTSLGNLLSGRRLQQVRPLKLGTVISWDDSSQRPLQCQQETSMFSQRIAPPVVHIQMIGIPLHGKVCR